MKNCSTRNISDFLFSPPVAVLCCCQQLIAGSYTVKIWPPALSASQPFALLLVLSYLGFLTAFPSDLGLKQNQFQACVPNITLTRVLRFQCDVLKPSNPINLFHVLNRILNQSAFGNSDLFRFANIEPIKLQAVKLLSWSQITFAHKKDRVSKWRDFLRVTILEQSHFCSILRQWAIMIQLKENKVRIHAH